MTNSLGEIKRWIRVGRYFRWALSPISVIGAIGLNLISDTSDIGLKRTESDIIYDRYWNKIFI
jgi:hypothetical protein